MQIKLRVLAEENQEDLDSLYQWLMDDKDVRDEAQIELIAAPGSPGSMAGDVALLSLIFSTTFNALNFALSFRQLAI